MSIEKSMDNVKKNVDFEDIVDIAKKITNNSNIQVLDYSLNDYSQDKFGFTATHHILKITVQNSKKDINETLSAFVKIACIPMEANEFDQNIDVNIMMTNRESFFLQTLVSQFKDIYKSEKWWPQHYYTRKNVIIMEDLKSIGYEMFETIYDNYGLVKSVLDSLARFHSCSILAEARMKQESKYPAVLNERYKDHFSEMLFVRSRDEKSWFPSTTKLSCKLAEHFGHNPEIVRKLFDRACDMVQTSSTHRNVVCHGDVHSKNLMFANGSPLPNCILIDFQTYRYAPMVTDVLQCLHVNTSSNFRKQHDKDLIAFYHTALTESIKISDTTGTIEIPTLEDINKGMEELRLFGLVIACIYYPIVFLDPELRKEHSRDSEFIKNVVFGDRIDFTFSHMKVNDFYRAKIEEAFAELIEKNS